jgi:uncharacterized membrane protein
MFPEINNAAASSSGVEARATASVEGEEHHQTYTMAIGFFIAQRFFVGLWFMWTGYLVPMIKGTMMLNACIILFSSALWIASIHVSWPNQLALIFLAIFMDLFGGSIVIIIVRLSKDRKGLFRHIKKVCDIPTCKTIRH